jgi:uncharacterized RDD family membrane protein YckC
MGGRDDRRDRSGSDDSAGDEYRPERGGDQYGDGPERGDGDQYASQGDDYDQQGGRGGYQQGGRREANRQGGHGGGHDPGGGYPQQGAGGYGTRPSLHTNVLGKRIGAHIIDNLLLLVFAIVLVIVVGVGGGATGPTTSAADTAVGGLAIIVGVVGALFYLFLLEGYWDGQTVGKRAVNIRVVKEDGSEIGYAESVIRNVIEIFEGLFYYIPAILVIAISDRDQRLGDHAASTLVIDDDPDPRAPQQGSRQPPQGRQQQPAQGHGRQQHSQQGRQNSGQGSQYQHPPADRNRQSRQSGDR